MIADLVPDANQDKGARPESEPAVPPAVLMQRAPPGESAQASLVPIPQKNGGATTQLTDIPSNGGGDQEQALEEGHAPID